jgi:beta-fructofuranosidase
MRPAFHFTAPAGWINDPLGLTFHGDRFHLFYQHVPDAIDWSPRCRWGHATSDDLLTWDTEPIALEPGDGDGGCWSGSVAVEDDGRAALFYTSIDEGAFDIGEARIAKPAAGSETDWIVWEKGPVVARVPDGEDVVAFRDPFVFRDGPNWRMLIGAGRTDGTAVAYGYVSDDLESWRYDGVVAERHRGETEELWTGSVWECPQLIEVDGRWVLLVSVWEPVRQYYTAYAVGDLVDGRFIQESSWQRLTYGPSYYAGAVFHDADGRPGIIYWLRGVSDPDSGWAGAHSIPHLLELSDDVLQVSLPVVLDERRETVGTLEDMAASPQRLEAGFDIEWSEGGALSADEGIRNVFRLRQVAGILTVTADAGIWQIPCIGPVRIVGDGSIVEVIGSFGALAFAASRSGNVVLTAQNSTGTAFTLQ